MEELEEALVIVKHRRESQNPELDFLHKVEEEQHKGDLLLNSLLNSDAPNDSSGPHFTCYASHTFAAFGWKCQLSNEKCQQRSSTLC
jgi:hypothetical protein